MTNQITIELEDGSTTALTPLYINGDWATHEDDDLPLQLLPTAQKYISITHLITGAKVIEGFFHLHDACACVDDLNRLAPEQITNPEGKVIAGAVWLIRMFYITRTCKFYEPEAHQRWNNKLNKILQIVQSTQ